MHFNAADTKNYKQAEEKTAYLVTLSTPSTQKKPRFFTSPVSTCQKISNKDITCNQSKCYGNRYSIQLQKILVKLHCIFLLASLLQWPQKKLLIQVKGAGR